MIFKEYVKKNLLQYTKQLDDYFPKRTEVSNAIEKDDIIGNFGENVDGKLTYKNSVIGNSSGGSGGSGTTDYNDMDNKPRINNVALSGNKTAADLGLATADSVSTISQTVTNIQQTIAEGGADGEDGEDGFSPTVSTTAITGGTTVTITDAEGEHSFDIMNGADGEPGTNGTNGQDGVSPTVSLQEMEDGSVLMIVTDVNGTHTTTITNDIATIGGLEVSSDDMSAIWDDAFALYESELSSGS